MSDAAKTGEIVPLKSGARAMAIVPQSIEEVFRLATAVSKSGIAPKGMEKPEALTVAIMHGLELGLPPMQAIQRIAVINGRPTVWGDALPAMLWSRGFSLQERFDDGSAYCTVVRPNGEAITRSFSVADAKKAGLWGKSGPWSSYPERMLQMRARGFACRDGAADVLGGLYIAEEAQDIVEITPQRKSSAQAKRDGDMERVLQPIQKEIADATSPDDLDVIRDRHAQALAELPTRWAELIEEDFAARATELTPQAAE